MTSQRDSSKQTIRQANKQANINRNNILRHVSNSYKEILEAQSKERDPAKHFKQNMNADAEEPKEGF